MEPEPAVRLLAKVLLQLQRRTGLSRTKAMLLMEQPLMELHSGCSHRQEWRRCSCQVLEPLLLH